MVSLVEAAALSLANITGLCYKQVTSARVCMCVCVHVCVCACVRVHVCMCMHVVHGVSVPHAMTVM